MSLKTYPHPGSITRIDKKDDGVQQFNNVRPGDWVTHTLDGGFGMAVAITDDEISVVWSVEPKDLDFSKIIMPLVRRVAPPLFRNQLVGIQPMSVPAGCIFYLDYKYPDPIAAELDKKCNEGPWWHKVYYRSKRCLTTHMPSRLSSFWSWLRGSSFTKLTSAGTPKKLQPVAGSNPPADPVRKWTKSSGCRR